MRLFSICTLLLFFSKSAFSTKCVSLEDVKMTVYSSGGVSYETSITGCIERVAFPNPVVEVYVKHQNIPRLGRDSVRNMKHLHTVTFDNCGVKVVAPGAFRNVPNLKSVRIVSGVLEEVPNGVFSALPKLGILKFHRNKIKTIERGAFAGISTLKQVFCDHNELREWDPRWFTNSTNLEIVDFQRNKIRSLPRRAFYDLPNVKEIYFEYNELETVQPEAFTTLQKLKYLGLRYNRLKSLDSKVFPTDMFIDTLTIDANYFNFLSRKVLAALVVKRLTVDGNPWKCPCLDRVLLWLHEMNATAVRSDNCVGDSVPVCSFASTFSTSCTEMVDNDVTRRYLDELRKVDPPLDKYCARLD
jgi:Leucine-rich repeat (LRR) protein